MSLLESISGPRDLDRLSKRELTQLAGEVREFLVENVSQTGGHLGPNLGVVELTIALHRVFDSPGDPIVWDTGHQSYVHKLLTGRQDFAKLRSRGGLAGYPQRSESEHDVVESSHASSSLSWADGISRAFARTGRDDRHVVAVVGDGALTGGMTWEALNNITDDNDRNLVIVVNDNGRSYAPTIGGMARYLNRIRTGSTYRDLDQRSGKAAHRLGRVGRALYRGVRGGTHGFLSRLTNNSALYAQLDIKYLGPVDGHDLPALIETLEQAKRYSAPVIVHAITEKGRGYAPARNDEADQFHAVNKIDPKTGKPVGGRKGRDWTGVFAEALVEVGERRPDVIAMTAAMLRPTGLGPFAEKFPERVYDVGIAEQHAVTFAAGMACEGLKPVVAIYSTFLQRAYDQLIHDVALQKLPVVFALDRAGLVGADGATHAGAYDIAFVRCIPHMSMACPADERECRQLLTTAYEQDHPVAVRYPRGAGVGVAPLQGLEGLPFGKGEVRRESAKKKVAILAFGTLLYPALAAAEALDATVVNMRWAKPLDEELLRQVVSTHELIVTVEEGCIMGGAGSAVAESLQAAGITRQLLQLGLPDEFIEHGDPARLLALQGLDAAGIEASVRAHLAPERAVA
jgi:1-deoxy-D-xylulose-5-phosphate synthase